MAKSTVPVGGIKKGHLHMQMAKKVALSSTYGTFGTPKILKIPAKTLNITAKDIKVGKPGHPCDCPIARAAQRRYPGKLVHVGIAAIRITDPRSLTVGVSIFLPEKAIKFISLFDSGQCVRPFSFIVQPTE